MSHLKYLELAEIDLWARIPFTKLYFSEGSKMSVLSKMDISQHCRMVMNTFYFRLAQEAEKETEVNGFVLLFLS